MQNLVITGAAGNLGQRVLALLAEVPAGPDGPVWKVTAVDRVALPVPGGPDVLCVMADLATADLKELFDGADVVLHLASTADEDTVVSAQDLQNSRRVLEAAGDAGVRHLVLISSAAVYGAWPDNPVPLTEVAPLRPNPGFYFAASRAELERAAADWRDDHPGSTVTLLRPAITPSTSGVSGWLYKAVQPGIGDRVVQALPPLQFVHRDDVASAVVQAATLRLDGPVNVAPDGWIRGEDAPALLGTAISVPVPGRAGDLMVGAAAWARGLFRGRSRPDGAVAWTRHPWVVANDRLRSTGWVPASTSEETIIAARRPSPLATLYARRRQEVTLAAVIVASLAGLGVTAALVRRWRRRR